MKQIYQKAIASLVFGAITSIGTILTPTLALAQIPIFKINEYEAHYKVKLRGINVGKGITQLRRLANGDYRLASKTQPSIPFFPYHYIESADFSFEKGQVIPFNYMYDHREGSRTRKGRVLFDWSDKKIKADGNKVTYEHDITKGIQSKLSQAVMLQQDLALGKKQITYCVAEDDEIKEYIYKVIGKEHIKTVLGMTDTLKIEYDEPHKNRSTVSWHAINYNFIPVKVIHIRKGKTIGGGELAKLEPIVR